MFENSHDSELSGYDRLFKLIVGKVLSSSGIYFPEFGLRSVEIEKLNTHITIMVFDEAGSEIKPNTTGMIVLDDKTQCREYSLLLDGSVSKASVRYGGEKNDLPFVGAPEQTRLLEELNTFLN
ncbi:MAG TPA: hypothetical protein VII94_05325 [Candidatus Saccharimonadales bacterium]